MWNKTKEIQDIVTLSADVEMDNWELGRMCQPTSAEDLEKYMKTKFAEEFVQQILDKDLIQISKKHNGININFSAELNIVSNSEYKVVVSKYEYEVYGKPFSHKQIKEAVGNYFLEVFL